LPLKREVTRLPNVKSDVATSSSQGIKWTNADSLVFKSKSAPAVPPMRLATESSTSTLREPGTSLR
jgi:hypothetical protein